MFDSPASGLAIRQAYLQFAHGKRPHRIDPAGNAWAAENAAGCCDGMGTRRSRRRALLAPVGLAHARSANEQNSRGVRSKCSRRSLRRSAACSFDFWPIALGQGRTGWQAFLRSRHARLPLDCPRASRLGLGHGGEWPTGTTLVAGSWFAGFRGQGDLARAKFARCAVGARHFGRSFLGTGISSGGGIVGSEIFPTAVRAPLGD